MRSLTCSVAIALFAAVRVFAQPLPPSSLDPRVVASVDRLYPGFMEILESNDSAALARLARTLSSAPSPESLTVLFWMLQCCPSWSTDETPSAQQISRVVRAVGRLSLASLSGALRTDDAEQRNTAAVVLSSHVDLIPPGERDGLQKLLIGALSDPSIHVRVWLARAVRALGSAEGEAALARSLEDPAVTNAFLWAIGRKRPLPVVELNASSFAPATVAAVGAIAPDFLDTLRTRNEPAVRGLTETIQRNKNPDTTPVLVWLLANGDIGPNVGWMVRLLAEPPHSGRLPVGELTTILMAGDPDRRLAVADLFAQVFRARPTPIGPAARERAVAALIECLRDPNIDIRMTAARALGGARATNAVGALAAALDGRDVTRFYAEAVIGALRSIDSVEALPALERWARSARPQYVRNAATYAFLAIAKPADPAGEARRFLWEQPGTAFERAVLARGRTALPLAWQALAKGSSGERRAAAALLGWFPDVGSIRPILAALGESPGALTREQLLFDLNMILLAEGTPPDGQQRNALAAEHLRWLYDQVANQRIDSDIRSMVLAQKTIAVFPDRVVAPFSVELSTQAARNDTGPTREQFSATAVRLESPQAFRDAVAKHACGVAFHAITAAEGVARVATTLYLPGGRIANQIWISLYRHEGGRWVPLQVPSHPVLHRMLNEPNLLPAINRNYGADHPLKVLRLDLTMERIRVDLKASQYLHNENMEPGASSHWIDASYARLLDRYKQSDAPSVRYTAEFESARLTGEPDVQLWIDTLAEQPGTPFQTMAQQVVGDYALRLFERERVELAGVERAQLIAAAVSPEAVDPRLRPQPLPRAENIRQVQRSGRFGLVEAVFGSGNLGMSGYSMLFERRGNEWVFLCVIRGWIS